jgi:NADH-quinone oxidoreductase subunit H
VTTLVRPKERVSALGKVILLALFVLFVLLLPALLVGVGTGIVGRLILDAESIVQSNIGVARFVVAVTAILLFTIPTAFIIIFLELKVIAFINLRIGPNRTGPWGTLASLVHGLKVLSKEDFTPVGVDVVVFTLAPVVTFVGSVMVLLVLPFGPGLVGQDMNIAVLYFFAMGGLTVVGLLMGGWASYNKYSLLGGLRSAAQMVSYEIPLTLSVVGVIMLAGTLSLNSIVLAQSGNVLDWFVIRQPLAFVIFFLAATAEGNRTPFDMSVADQELVGGFSTEYSGMRFGFFYFAEYVNVFIISALAVVFFFGGWTSPLPWPWPVTINLDPGLLGVGLLGLVLVVPVVATVVLALPFWMLRSSLPFWKALIIGFVLFNLLAGAAISLYLLVSFEALVGVIWFFAKTYVFVFVFVQMRATLPRIRIDQLMGLAWKWLLPASLANIFLTAIAVLLVTKS